jgi:hypothetical protein
MIKLSNDLITTKALNKDKYVKGEGVFLYSIRFGGGGVSLYKPGIIHPLPNIYSPGKEHTCLNPF